jgi:hypothetical protein
MTRTPDQLLVVNVRSRWSEVLRGDATDEEVVLGDWNLADRDIDPDRIAVLIGVSRRAIVRAWPVQNPQLVTGYDRPRIRFEPAGDRLRHLEGMPSPYAWRRGEMYPVVSIPLDQLDIDPAAREPVNLGSAGEARIGGYTLRVDGQTATVTVPAGRHLTVLTLMGEAPGSAAAAPGRRTATGKGDQG